jgi:DNA (cytosine-5)-methyltransferase 1
VLNAADFAVPQDRQRLFLIGARRGLPMPDYPAPTGATTVAEAIGDLPDADRHPELTLVDSTRIEFETAAAYARRLRGLDVDPTDFGYRRAFDPHLLTSSLRTEHTELSKRRFAETLHGKTEPVSRFHKLDPQGRCNTLRAGTDSARGAFTSPRPIHPFVPRVVTVREAARLHSYPDWFRFHVTKWHGFRQIGNSVPPLLGRAVAGEIVKVLGVEPSKPAAVVRPGNGNEELLSFDMSEAARFFGVPTGVIAQRTRKAQRCARTEELSFV